MIVNALVFWRAYSVYTICFPTKIRFKRLKELGILWVVFDSPISLGPETPAARRLPGQLHALGGLMVLLIALKTGKSCLAELL